MRVILGKTDSPDSAHILVIRGIDIDSLDYFTKHKSAYPTWGVLLFPEYKQPKVLTSFPETTAIHRIFMDSSVKFSECSDEQVLEVVEGLFPPYTDDDPVVPLEDTSEDIGMLPSFSVTLQKFQNHRRISRMELTSLPDDFERQVRIVKNDLLNALMEDDRFWKVEIDSSDIRGSIRVGVELAVCEVHEEDRWSAERARKALDSYYHGTFIGDKLVLED